MEKWQRNMMQDVISMHDSWFDDGYSLTYGWSSYENSRHDFVNSKGVSLSEWHSVEQGWLVLYRNDKLVDVKDYTPDHRNADLKGYVRQMR